MQDPSPWPVRPGRSPERRAGHFLHPRPASARPYTSASGFDKDAASKTDLLADQPPPYSRSRTPDIESQSPLDEKKALKAQPLAAEYSVQTRTKLSYLAAYFLLNLTLTIYNKAVLGKFHFPWLLTTLHTSFASVGCYVLMLRGHFRLTKLDYRQNLVLVAFSFLFTMNIAISNVSLDAVSVPFHQIMRSTTPIFAVLIYRFVYHRKYSTATYLSILPIILGVAIATYGDYYFTLYGFILTLSGVILAAAKTIVSNRMMTGTLALPAYEILLRMSPMAALQSILYSWMTGESGKFGAFVSEGGLPLRMVLALLGNGFIAFVLNVSSFQTNKLAGALTITVAGNLKQCLTIVLGIELFNVHVSLMNGLGMVITLIGAGWYSKVELDAKGRR